MSKNSTSYIPDALGAGAVSLAFIAIAAFSSPAEGAPTSEAGIPYCVLTTNGSESKVAVFEKTPAGAIIEKAPQSETLKSVVPGRPQLSPGLTGTFMAPNVAATVYSWKTKMNGQARVTGHCRIAGLSDTIPMTDRQP